MSDVITKPAPDLYDPDMGPFWRNLRQHRLTAQRCRSCRSLRFPALPICPTCLETGSDWVDVSGAGTIWSFAVYHRAFHAGFKADLPYTVAMVENQDGLTYTGNLIGPREVARVGARVRVVFEDQGGGFTLPKWQVVTD